MLLGWISCFLELKQATSGSFAVHSKSQRIEPIQLISTLNFKTSTRCYLDKANRYPVDYFKNLIHFRFLPVGFNWTFLKGRL
jgi:hypothetical protein